MFYLNNKEGNNQHDEEKISPLGGCIGDCRGFFNDRLRQYDQVSALVSFKRFRQHLSDRNGRNGFFRKFHHSNNGNHYNGDNNNFHHDNHHNNNHYDNNHREKNDNHH